MDEINQRTCQPQPIGLIIGRWQPPHRGHVTLIQTALSRCSHVLIVIGSALQARHPRNPFSFEERQAMLRASLAEADKARITCLALRDYYDLNLWGETLKSLVAQHNAHNAEVILFGYKKDWTSEYLNHFPNWHYEELKQALRIDAKMIRQTLFAGNGDQNTGLNAIANWVAPGVYQYLSAWLNQEGHFVNALEQLRALEHYRALLPNHTLHEACLVIVYAKQVLCLYGQEVFNKNLLTLPTTFIAHAASVAAQLKLLLKETIQDFDNDLCLDLLDQVIFNHPLRSWRGHIVCTAYRYAITEQQHSYLKDALWLSHSDIFKLEDCFFEDHAHIARTLCDCNEYLIHGA